MFERDYIKTKTNGSIINASTSYIINLKDETPFLTKFPNTIYISNFSTADIKITLSDDVSFRVNSSNNKGISKPMAKNGVESFQYRSIVIENLSALINIAVDLIEIQIEHQTEGGL